MPLKHEKPNPALLARLNAVANRANSLQEILRGENMLPTDFPEEQLSTYLDMMKSLPNGTAEGCRIPLEQMRNELPRISAENIHDTETLKEKYANLGEEDLPPLQPDGNLDTGLDLVISAVTKAYDEYRRQAADASEDEKINSAMRTIPQDAEAAPLLVEIDAVNERVLVDYNEANDTLPENNTAADNYKRSIKDAENANLTAKGFLKGNRIVRRWFRKSITALKKSAPAIETTGKILKNSGVPIGGISLLAGLSVPEAALTVVMLKQLGENIEGYANYLDSKDYGTETSLQPLPPIPDIDPELQEIAEEKALKLLKAGKAIPSEIGINVRYLGSKRKQISLPSYSLLGRCPYLLGVYLEESTAIDVTALSKYKYLENLGLNYTQVRDLAPLSNLLNLKDVSLTHSQVIELVPLSGLKKLGCLYLSNTQVTDLAPLSDLTELESLYLNNTPVKELTSLSGLKKLKTLFLNFTQVSELTAIIELTKMRSLHLDHTKIRDLTSLSELIELKFLYLRSTRITDLAPLSGLTGLKRLYLNNTQVADLTPLRELINLEVLHLDNSQVTDLTPLSGLIRLNDVSAKNLNIQDWTPVSHVETVLGRPK